MRTCFTEKFGAPRQSLMVEEARGVLKLRSEHGFREAVKGLESFSHVWVIYVFDRHVGKPWRPTIEPPRIDAPRRVGVLASRSPHRPNPIGLSVVRLDRIDLAALGGIEIHLSGVDILDGTPVLDIKPYLPYADHVPGAASGWIQNEIRKHAVEFSARASEQIEELKERHPRLKELIAQMLGWDPRPRSQREAMPLDASGTWGKRFGFRILGWDVQWEAREGGIVVVELVDLGK
jgi:tRNA-Thr(GGU) m(6)t(6)A37 methyltransferase TsaA